jgi:predicted outer membrane repeat protein
MSVEDSSTVVLDGVTFNDNKATDSALVSVAGNSTLEVRASGLQNNLNAARSGGLLEAQDAGNLYVHNSTFTSNQAAQGGVLHANDSSIVRVEFCTFLNNSARLAGGSMYLQNSAASIDQTSFFAGAAPVGGALYHQNSLVSLISSVLYGNTAANSGGGLYCLNGLAGSTTNLTTFDSNSAKQNGGGVYESKCETDIMNSLFQDNLAGGNGSAIWRSDSPGLLAGVTFNLTSMAAARSLVYSFNSSPVDLTTLRVVPPNMTSHASFDIS